MGKVSFLVNGQMMQLGDSVYVITKSYKEDKRRRIIPAKEKCIAEGTLDSLKFSSGYGNSIVCTGTAICLIPTARQGKEDMELITRLVEFNEADISKSRSQMENRLERLKKEEMDRAARDSVYVALLDTVERAVTLVGYVVLDGDDDGLIVRDGDSDRDFRIAVTEETC